MDFECGKGLVISADYGVNLLVAFTTCNHLAAQVDEFPHILQQPPISNDRIVG